MFLRFQMIALDVSMFSLFQKKHQCELFYPTIQPKDERQSPFSLAPCNMIVEPMSIFPRSSQAGRVSTNVLVHLLSATTQKCGCAEFDDREVRLIHFKGSPKGRGLF